MDSVYILPMFKYVPYLPRVSFEHAEALVRAYLQPETLHPMYADLSPIHRDRLVRKPVYGNILYGVRDVEDVMVLICGHGSRDARCGLYGPLLKAEFERHLPVKGVEVVRGAVQVLKNEWKGQKELGGAVEEAMEDEGVKPKATARVGLISHIGGHKFAGNVVIYIPPGMKTKKGNPHPLAGHGIWYGRVQPSNVEGIVQETVVRGIVIEELFRGAIKQSGEIVTL
jgi:(2Fe-2S) ferredoxin